MSNEYGTKALNDRVFRTRLNSVLRRSFLRDQQFIPKNATMPLKTWLLSLNMTKPEREIAEDIMKNILLEYERRLRLLRQEISQEVFHRFGG